MAQPTRENNFAVDFHRLADLHPALKPWFNNDQYAFGEPEAVSAMSQALLCQFYGLNPVFLTGRLVPRVFNRVSYLNWVHNLLVDTAPEGSSPQATGEPQAKAGLGTELTLGHPPEVTSSKTGELVTGFDIGTGHSLIYPMLGHALYGWSFIATDIDPQSLETAKANITANALDLVVTLRNHSASPDLLLSGSEEATFTMCNPPFYASYEHLVGKYFLKSAHKMALPLIQASYDELVHPDGGEVGFLAKMVRQSKALQPTSTRWYTSLVGLYDTVAPTTALLEEVGVTNYVVNALSEGADSLGRTRRWIIGWSFGPDRPRIASVGKGAHKTVERIRMDLPVDLGMVVECLHQRLELGYELQVTEGKCVFSCTEGVWTRAYRRKKDTGVKKRKGAQSRFELLVDGPGHLVEIWWKHGDDFKLFESFQGWLRKNMKEMW